MEEDRQKLSPHVTSLESISVTAEDAHAFWDLFRKHKGCVVCEHKKMWPVVEDHNTAWGFNHELTILNQSKLLFICFNCSHIHSFVGAKFMAWHKGRSDAGT